jgi:YVTN family beta-propeller protein
VAIDLDHWALCYNPTNNKVYCAEHHGVVVIDGATDSVTATVRTGSSPVALCYDSTYNKVYCVNGNNVTVIDGAADTVVVTIGVGVNPTALAWNPAQSRVYVANYAEYASSSISVLRDTGGFVGVESFRPQATGSKPLPTIIRGVMYVPEASSHKPQAASLLDISGRKVLDMHAGANDVRTLAPGVYFVRTAQAQAQAQAIRKVVVTR